MVHFESAEIPLVHPDDLGTRLDGPVQFESSWTSTRAVNEQRRARSRNVRSSVSVEGGDDQQHGVGPHQAGVHHITGIDREVLPKHGEGAGRPGRAQILVAPAEELGVGQHGQAGRSPGLVLLGHGDRIEVRDRGPPWMASDV